VVERLSKASEKRDLLVLNFGLHFSETYKQELEQLVQQVAYLKGSFTLGLHEMLCRLLASLKIPHLSTRNVLFDENYVEVQL